MTPLRSSCDPDQSLHPSELEDVSGVQRFLSVDDVIPSAVNPAAFLW